MAQHRQGQRRFTGSVKRAPYFNPEKDAGILHVNLRGVGNDEVSVITLLSSRTNVQRQEIARSYSATYGRDLMHDFKSESSGDFQSMLMALLQIPSHYDAACLHKAMKGLGTDEKTLIEILVSRTKDDIAAIKSAYLEKYEHDLEKDLEDETSGNFRKLLLMLLSGSRENCSKAILTDIAKQDGRTLSGTKWNNSEADPNRLLEIFCTRNFPQLCVAFCEYERITGRDILKMINSEFSGHLKDALKTIVEIARYPPAYFAERLYRAMKGAGTNDSTLIRVVVSRSEIDMIDVKKCFQEKHGKPLEKYIDGDTSGSYKKLLIALVT